MVPRAVAELGVGSAVIVEANPARQGSKPLGVVSEQSDISPVPEQRLNLVSGQVSIDSDSKLVAPGDLAGQARQVYANLRTALAEQARARLT